MKPTSSSTNNMSSTTTAAVHEKPADSIERESPNDSKNYQNSIANVAVDGDAQSFEAQRKNNCNITSLVTQLFIGTTQTHK